MGTTPSGPRTLPRGRRSTKRTGGSCVFDHFCITRIANRLMTMMTLDERYHVFFETNRTLDRSRFGVGNGPDVVRPHERDDRSRRHSFGGKNDDVNGWDGCRCIDEREPDDLFDGQKIRIARQRPQRQVHVDPFRLKKRSKDVGDGTFVRIERHRAPTVVEEGLDSGEQGVGTYPNIHIGLVGEFFQFGSSNEFPSKLGTGKPFA